MKIGSASWIKRGTYLENSNFLNRRVDFVELLVYTWNSEIKELLSNELARLKKLSLFYTVHLPLDTMANCREAYSFFKESRFPITSFNLHPLRGWEKFICDKPDVILENLIDICIPFERMCLDFGHLKLSKKEDFLLNSRDLKTIKEFHIHGVQGKKDHCLLNSSTLNYISALAERYPAVLEALKHEKTLMTFEIFDIKRLMISLNRLRLHLRKVQ
jgi:hypothetical protein